jgi:aminopeptidase 2
MGEVIIPNRIWPDWRMDSEFISDHLNRALGLDAKLSSHPIEVDCPDANHINQVGNFQPTQLACTYTAQIFDALSYSKAASGTFMPCGVPPILTWIVSPPHVV